MIVAWFSGGITSAITCKKALDLYENVHLVYIETGSHHEDNDRFIKECQEWYGQPIEIIQSAYKNVFDVIKRDRYINGPSGARCTKVLKRKVRQNYEYGKEIKAHVWGFHYDKKEIARAERIKDAMLYVNHSFPLIENKLSKENCLCLLEKTGIEKPTMYKLGYNNNNCIGCVKGGMGYWNKIRIDFPNVFKKMSELEREIGRSCIKNRFLDELKITEGHDIKEIMPECGVQCELDLK